MLSILYLSYLENSVILGYLYLHLMSLRMSEMSFIIHRYQFLGAVCEFGQGQR